jgi:hypothetical protein
VSRAATAVRLVRLLWVAPLALCSFAFHRAMRAAFRSLAARVMSRGVERANHWQVLSRALLDRRGVLPVIMLTAPRWNTHAIIGNVGPIEVKGALSIEVATAARSARSWSIVVYRFPRSITVCSTGSSDPSPADAWKTIALPPGTYSLGLRYYHTAQAAELPAVRVDGEPYVPALALSADALSVYDAVRDRRGVFYRLVHHYVFHVLDYRAWLPPAFVQREFLPVGNPQTQFRYGAVRRGQSIRVQLAPALLASHDVFFTTYNRCSFPVTWCTLTTELHVTGPLATTGFYLVRMHRRTAGPGSFDLASDLASIEVSCT